MYLEKYNKGNYTPGAPLWRQLLWYFVGSPLHQSSWLPISSFKVFLLRCFGAKIGTGVRIKPGVKVKFPWKLSVGDHSWLGENLWIDNLASVKIDDNVCVSQGVYICTGNHDWSQDTFDLKISSIQIKSSAWIGAHSKIAPGVIVGQGAILTLGSTANKSLEPMHIYSGNPAKSVKQRCIKHLENNQKAEEY